MKDTKIKPAALIFTGVIVALLVFMMVRASHHLSRFVPTPPPVAEHSVLSDLMTNTSGINIPGQTDTTAQVGSGQPTSVCYHLNNTTAAGTDNVSLELTTTDGQHSTGELAVALAGKDASTGTLNGTLSPNSDNTGAVFDGEYTNMQEGMNTTDEQLIELDQNEAKIGYGQMVPNTGGGYSYQNPSAVDYSLVVPRVDCGQ